YQVRYRSTRSLELRLGNQAERGLRWLVGVYGFELAERLTDLSAGVYADPFDATQDFVTSTLSASDFRSRSGAVYAQLDGDLGARTRWSIGLRGERHTARYDDRTTYVDAAATANHFSPADNLWGGQASLDFALSDQQHVYALLARGYKASGFNLSPG